MTIARRDSRNILRVKIALVHSAALWALTTLVHILLGRPLSLVTVVIHLTEVILHCIRLFLLLIHLVCLRLWTLI